MGLFGKIGLFHWRNTHDNKDIQTALEHVELWNIRNTRIGDLSQGQQQRAFIARALVGKPEVLFLDEPTTGVDIQTREEFYKLLKKINHELHITLILVSHEIDIVTRETTEVACINHSLMYHGTPKEFVEENILPTIYGNNIKMLRHDHNYGTVSV
jgi:zinc transport system ATP-binding protein